MCLPSIQTVFASACKCFESFLKSCKQIVSCCLPKLKECETYFPLLKEQWSLCSFHVRLCGMAGIFFSYSLYHHGTRFIHVLGITQSELTLYAKIQVVFLPLLLEKVTFRQIQKHKIEHKKDPQKEENTSKLLFAPWDGLSKCNQSVVGTKSMWFVYGICCLHNSFFC